jgi:putative endopeptidase
VEHYRNKGYKLNDEDYVFCPNIEPYKCLDKYMKEENLNDLKLYLAVAVTAPFMQNIRSSLWISNPAEVSEDGKLSETCEEQYQRGLSEMENLIPFDLDQIYTKKHYSKEFRDGFQKIVDEFHSEYKKAINICGYGPTIRANMLKKLDKMKVYSLCPDDKTYEKLRIPYDLTTAEEGGNLADNLLKVYAYCADMERMTIGTKETSIDWWYPDEQVFDCLLPKENNAFFNSSTNIAVFFHGVIGTDSLFTSNPEEDPEIDTKNLAYLACTIGHEMGHAFDFQGSCFDEDGYLVDIWGDDDKSVYQQKVDKLADIYDSINVCTIPAKKKAYYQDGHKTVGEAMADLGGTEIALRILKEKYPGRDDLIQKFYIYTAEQWIDTSWDNYSEWQVKAVQGDVHPCPRARTNGVTSMMEDYYRVFDVKETDAMYVAPEDRVRLW